MKLAVALIWAVILSGAGIKPSGPWQAALGSQGDKLNDPQFVAEGAKLFAPTCGSGYCHGAAGVGGGAPKLRERGLDAQYLFRIISSGIPGTPMRAFKSDFSEEQIWKLVAFIRSTVKESGEVKLAERPASTEPTARATSELPGALEAGRPPLLAGDAEAGKKIFFDSTRQKSCHACHSFQDAGSAVGPDLSNVGSKSAKDLFLSIIMAGETKDPQYATVSITLKDGEKIVGIKKEEDEEALRVYDTTALPAVLRTIQKSNVAKSEMVKESVMPRDYACVYTVKQLLDIVTFLKSSDLRAKSPVTLRDLF